MIQGTQDHKAKRRKASAQERAEKTGSNPAKRMKVAKNVKKVAKKKMTRKYGY